MKGLEPLPLISKTSILPIILHPYSKKIGTIGLEPISL